MEHDLPFSELPPNTLVQPCEERAPKGTPGGWTQECVLKILCRKDQKIVQQLAKSNVETANKVWYDDPYFHGKVWTTHYFPAGGSSYAPTKTIMVLQNQSCEQAAVTCYHEVWHQNQPKMDWPNPSEDDAYYNAELWTIERGLPSQYPTEKYVDPRNGKVYLPVRKKSSSGRIVPDKAAIRHNVENDYPSPPPPVAGRKQPIPIGHRIGPAGPETEVQDPYTGEVSWRPSKEGDTYAGEQQTEGFKTMDPTSWKCP